MATKIKSKFKIGIAMLCTLMMLISIIPTDIIGGWNVNADGEVFVAGSVIYFDTGNNSDAWGKAGPVYVWFKNDGDVQGDWNFVSHEMVLDQDHKSLKDPVNGKIYKYTLNGRLWSDNVIMFTSKTDNYGEKDDNNRHLYQTDDLTASSLVGKVAYYNYLANDGTRKVKVGYYNESDLQSASLAGSTVGFVDMTSSSTNTAITAKFFTEDEVASSDVNGMTFTVPNDSDDNGPYTKIKFYKNGEHYATYDLMSDSSGYNASSTNTFYYGATVNNTTQKAVNSYWAAPRGTTGDTFDKRLYLPLLLAICVVTEL